MRIFWPLVLSLCLGSTAIAEEKSHARLVCYGVDKRGDPSTATKGFVVVAQQLDASIIHGRIFIRGSLYYDEAIFVDGIPFSLSVYKNTNPRYVPKSTEKSINELLLTTPDVYVPKIEGAKVIDSFSVAWTVDGVSNMVAYENDDQNLNLYAFNSDSDKRFIWCDPPYLVAP